MKTTITTIIIILSACLAFSQTVEVPTEKDELPDIVIGSPTSGHWLTIHRDNHKSHEQRGFDPSYVCLISDFKPVVRKHGEKWEITFQSDLPGLVP